MANYDELKQKVLDTLSVISGKAVEVYDKAATKTKDLAVQAQINAAIVKEKNKGKKLLGELGKQYFAQYGEEPAEGVAQLCADITASNEKVQELQNLLAELKAAAAAEKAGCSCGCEDEEAECSCGCEEKEEEAGECCCCEKEAPAEEAPADGACCRMNEDGTVTCGGTEEAPAGEKTEE